MTERKDIPLKDRWDLTHIFKDKAAWQAAMDGLPDSISRVAALNGSFGEDAPTVKKNLDELYEVSRRVLLCYLYPMLLCSGDSSDAENQSMQQLAFSQAARFEEASSFVSPQLLALGDEKLDEIMADPIMADYRHMFESLRRTKEHTLSDDKEMMLAMLAEPAATPSDTFDMFADVDLTFPRVKGEEGEEVQLTHAVFGVLRESGSGEVRKEAFDKYFGAYKGFENTLACLYGGNVKMDAYIARVRGYNESMEAALDGDNVRPSVYTSLIEAVHDAIPHMGRYLELRKKVMGLDELHMYDLYVPLVEENDPEVTFPEAKEMVLEAVKPFGEEYGQKIRRAFDERWIDIYENKGKRAGAFSCDVYGVHPYVLLNFASRQEDAFTLAHELGHAMHSCFSSEAQTFANHEYSIMVAEVASTVNEMMLNRDLLGKAKTKGEKAALLNRLLEGFRTTVFRQTLFAEFELEAHRMYEAGEPLTAESLNALYRRLNELYYPGVVVDDITDVEWARIPHFYNAFYVYQYATGFCSAVNISRSVLEGDGAGRYLDFLRMGGSAYPLDELRSTGIDLEDPAAVGTALRVFADTVDELEKLLLEI